MHPLTDVPPPTNRTDGRAGRMATPWKVKESIRPSERRRAVDDIGSGSGGRIRTTDQGLMSPLLYH